MLHSFFDRATIARAIHATNAALADSFVAARAVNHGGGSFGGSTAANTAIVSSATDAVKDTAATTAATVAIASFCSLFIILLWWLPSKNGHSWLIFSLTLFTRG